MKVRATQYPGPMFPAFHPGAMVPFSGPAGDVAPAYFHESTAGPIMSLDDHANPTVPVTNGAVPTQGLSPRQMADLAGRVLPQLVRILNAPRDAMIGG